MGDQGDESLAGLLQRLDTLNERLKSAPREGGNAHIQVNVGGITNAIAICGFIACITLFVLFGTWMMWRQSSLEDAQAAWISVWNSKVADKGRTDERSDSR